MNRYQVVQRCSSNSLNSVLEFPKFRSLQALNYWNTCPLPSLTLILVLVVGIDFYSRPLTFSIYTGREDKVGKLGQSRIVRTRQDSQDKVGKLGQSRIVGTSQDSQDRVGPLGLSRIVRTNQDSQDSVGRRIVRARQNSQDKVGPLGLSRMVRTKYDGRANYCISRNNHVFKKKTCLTYCILELKFSGTQGRGYKNISPIMMYLF